jgi:hypothetical protein
MKKILYFACGLVQCFILQAGELQPVIEGKLHGQLGNQFFQIAATTSLALDQNAQAVFPDLIYQSEWNVPLNYKNVFFRFNTTAAAISYQYQEPHFHYAPIPYQPNMSLFGYFQSEKYFKHHKKEILELFAPSEEILSYLNSRYSEIIQHPKTVSVHIRMYKDTRPEYHPFVGWNYILQAILSFDSDSLFVVFSDQIDFCKKKLKKILTSHNVVFIEGNRHFQDLYLMSMCKHHIISNSSFSWWGAYLNQNPGKTVIAPSPSRWFGPSMQHCNTQDILPSEWRTL